MKHFDVFNGDADGLCALRQLRLASPRESVLVTGVKRDIALLRRLLGVPVASATVLDISLDANRDALLELLGHGVAVDYFDHHYAGEIPRHAALHAHIDTAAEVCTSTLVDRHLGGYYRVWAVVGAYGDNLADTAHKLAASIALEVDQELALRDLGECLNYNAYGDSEADLLVHPATLFAHLQQHEDPFDFMVREPLYLRIRGQRQRDMAQARAVAPHVALPCGQVLVLPDQAWSRRVRGSLGNELAREHPQLAHAVLTPDAQGGYVVSVRAPLATRRDAERLCLRFETGGGRAAAAGINHLPQHRLEAFLQAFEQVFALHVLR